MSEKEKEMIEKIAKLPPELQDRFSDKIDGAVMVLDSIKAEREHDAKRPIY